MRSQKDGNIRLPFTQQHSCMTEDAVPSIMRLLTRMRCCVASRWSSSSAASAARRPAYVLSYDTATEAILSVNKAH